MESKKILLAFALVAVAVSIGVASANVSADEASEESAFSCGGWKSHFGMKDGTFIKEKLGLPKDATQEDIQSAMESLREERLSTIKEKLGLPEDATEEEVITALEEWREDNKELIMGFAGFRMHGRMGHGMPFKNWQPQGCPYDHGCERWKA